MNILVTGGSGMVGRNLQEYLPPSENVRYLSTFDLDLTREDPIEGYFTFQSDLNCFSGKDSWYKPDLIIHLAALVGGIKANIENPYEYFLQNSRMNQNVVDYCVRSKTRLIALSSSCVYPETSEIANWDYDYNKWDDSAYPLHESWLHYGEPETTNRGYAWAKRMMALQLQLAKEQYGYDDWVVLYPSNLYGPHDHFDPDRGHLISAFIRKFHEAKINNDPTVTAFGTGEQLRQFTYVENLVMLLLDLIEADDTMIKGEYNFATPDNLRVADIIKTIGEVIGYTGGVQFSGELGGVFRKDVSNNKLEDALGRSLQFLPLYEGVRRAYDCYLANLGD